MHAARSARRLALPLAAAFALAVPGTAAAACPNASVAPADPAAPAATFCLLNVERAARGLAPLAASAGLAQAAGTYAQDMTARHFFAHESPDGGTLEQRVQAVGWFPARGAWTIGEDLAWGSGALGTPARIVAAWMDSPGHRANILQPAFTEVGIGIAAGAPQPGVQSAAGTYVADFGGIGASAAATDPAAATPADVAAAKSAIASAMATTRRTARRSTACVRAARRAKRAHGAKSRRLARTAARRCTR